MKGARRSFSLVEMVVTVIVLLILATGATMGYRQVLDNARQRVCRVNLNALEGAVEVYALENDVLPAVLGQLRPEHLKAGYARAMGEDDWCSRFSYAFVGFHRNALRYALMAAGEESAVADAAASPFLSPQTLEKYGVNPDVFLCPADSDGVPSYGLNEDLAGKKWADVREDDVIVADCNELTFSSESDFAERHIKDFGTKKFAQVITKEKKTEKKAEKEVEAHVAGGDNQQAAPGWNWWREWWRHIWEYFHNMFHR